MVVYIIGCKYMKCFRKKQEISNLFRKKFLYFCFCFKKKHYLCKRIGLMPVQRHKEIKKRCAYLVTLET